MNGNRRGAADPASVAQEVVFHPPITAEQVYHDYAPRVYHVARRMVRSDNDAEDVTQDVLLKVLRKLPSFRGDAAFPTWLHRVTVNAAIAHRRKEAVRDTNRSHDPFDILLEEGDIAGLAGKGEPTPDDELVNRETLRLIEQAITELPATYREAFVLADVEELSNAAVAARLKLSLPAVKSRLHRARQLLRRALAPHFEEAPAEARGA